MLRALIYILLFPLSIACTTCRGYVNEPKSAQQRFVEAMVDSSRELTSRDIYDGLVSLKYGASSMPEWKIVGRDTLILVASLQSADWRSSSIVVGDSFVTSSSPNDVMWVTIPREFDESLVSSLELGADSLSVNNRMLEVLGLRPDDTNSVVNLLWVNKDRLLRPSYNPDPTTTHGAITYPSNISDRWCREWYKEWFEGNVEYSYESPAEGLNYPFTRLGYTYDWGYGQSKYGLSEFIVEPSSEMIVDCVEGCWSYFKGLKR